MFETRPNKRKQWFYNRSDGGYVGSNSRRSHNLSPKQVAEFMLNRPEYRLGDNSSNVELAQLLVGRQEDQHLQDLFQLIVHDGLGKAIVADDEFFGNYPPKSSISYPNDFLSLGTMPTGNPTGVLISQLTGNLLLIGRTKSAKTSLLTVMLSYPELLSKVRVVVFAKKRELRELAIKPHLRELVITLKLEELILCYFQPPSGVPEPAWNNESTKIFAQCYARYAAHRLMGEKVNELMAHHPKHVYPTIRQLVNILNEFRPRFGMREAGYKESILWCLTDLLNCTGRIWDYSYSDFLEHVYSGPGLCIIEAEALPQEHLTFIATYFMRWLYLKRTYNEEGTS